jgi:hypothetical protein
MYPSYSTDLLGIGIFNAFLFTFSLSLIKSLCIRTRFTIHFAGIIDTLANLCKCTSVVLHNNIVSRHTWKVVSVFILVLVRNTLLRSVHLDLSIAMFYEYYLREAECLRSFAVMFLRKNENPHNISARHLETTFLMKCHQVSPNKAPVINTTGDLACLWFSPPGAATAPTTRAYCVMKM